SERGTRAPTRRADAQRPERNVPRLARLRNTRVRVPRRRRRRELCSIGGRWALPHARRWMGTQLAADVLRRARAHVDGLDVVGRSADASDIPGGASMSKREHPDREAVAVNATLEERSRWIGLAGGRDLSEWIRERCNAPLGPE